MAIGILVAVVAALIGVPVYAHVVYEDGHTYWSDTNCTWSRAEISHGSGGGYSKANLKSERNYFTSQCERRLSRPIGHLKAQWMLYKKSGSSWGHCRTGNWYYNGGDASALTNSRDHGTSPPCGSGEYRTKGDTGVKIGSTWYGGVLESGVIGHQLP
jgi:hypothetical protein